MHKKHITIALCALCAATPLLAQRPQSSGFLVKGTLCDSVTRQGEEFATVRLLPGNAQKAVRVATTQADGHFEIAAPKPGTYTLELVVIGKQPLRRSVLLTAKQPVVKVDTLLMREYDTTLGTATVTAQRPLVKAELDKMTYSMADDPEAQTNTLLEMLRKVPMVTVDGEDNIKVNGNSSFKVYVDGKPNAMMSANPSMIFKAYPASAIQKVEVITNPGAKYDAEGVAGVLNIITNTKTKTSGYSISPNINVNNHGVMGGLFGMGQIGKFMVSGHYGIGYSDNPTSTSYAEREVFADPVNHLLVNDQSTDSHGIFQFGSLDASYDISDKDLLSLSAGIHGWTGKNKTTSVTQMLDTEGGLTYAYQLLSRSDANYKGITASADYQHSFTDDTKLTLSYNFGTNPGNTKAETVNTVLEDLPDGFELTDQRTDPGNHSYEHTAQADFTTTLAKKHTLSVGTKYIGRINSSDSKEYSRLSGTDGDYTFNEDKSIRYRHQGNIAAGYAEYAFKTEKLSLMAGSRYEYYHVSVSYPDGKRPSFSSHMNDWVPSVSVGYNIKPTMMLKLGYNLRIGRPDISYLSPYVESFTPEVRSYGNPNLGSEKAHNISLTFSSFTTVFSINASLTHSFSNDGMVSYSFMEDGVKNTTYGNFQHSHTTMLSTFINWTIVKGTSVNLNASADYSDYKADKADIISSHNSGFSGSAWLGFRQDLPWKLKFGAWGGGSTGDYNLQGKTTGYFFYSLNLSRSFLTDDRLTIDLRAGNFIGRYRTFKSDEVTSQFRQHSASRYDQLRLGIGVRLKIGSLKASVKKVDRSISNDDVLSSGGGAGGGAQQGGGQSGE